MRLLYVADGRSPTTLSWLRFWIEQGDEVHLVSTYPCEPPPGLESFKVIPVAFGNLAGRNPSSTRAGMLSQMRRFLRPLRYLLGPASLFPYQLEFRKHVGSIRPDLVHAFRIPYEGILACVTPSGIPFVVSIWGNDITLHARQSTWMDRLTRRVLQRADGLLADASRDIRLGREWGLGDKKPAMTVPGAGGIRLDEIANANDIPSIGGQPLPDAPMVINPRGQRPGSLRQDVFFKAIPLILKNHPDTYFVCPALQGDPQAEGLVAELGISGRTILWPKISQIQLWSVMKKARVYVAPSLHDGTPNSLLEAMACGCFPVVGDIESMQEWIEDGENGFLVDATDEVGLAKAIAEALNNPVLQAQAMKINHALLEERADYSRNMTRVREFYRQVISK